MAEPLSPIRPVAAEPDPPVSRHRAWASGLIVALFIALASALLPGAVPASQMVGSAFNPATTQVALNRDENEQASVYAPQERRQRPALTGGGDVAALLPPPPLALLGQPYALTAIFPSDQPQASRHTFVRAGSGPRAPPATA